MDWQRVKRIFDEIADSPPGQRQALLDARCGQEDSLRAEVERLLILGDRSELTIDRPAARLDLLLGGTQPRCEAGTVLAGRYRIERFLGAGGMGEVWEAFDLERGHPVALKFIAARPAARDAAEARLEREVHLAGSLRHPNICRLFGLERHEGQRFLVMELLQGETLAERMEVRGAMTADEALPIVLDVCAGLEEAHAHGVVHRDLKPGNVFLTPERAVIIDFGLAAGDRASKSLTSAGAVIGTLAYMAPEQLEEGEGTAQSDIYALGVMMHEMLAGAKPFTARSPFRLAAQKARGAIRRPRVSSASCGPVWDEVIDRCLQVRPMRRYRSATQVRERLLAGKASACYLAGLWGRRFQVPVLALLCLAAVLLAWRGWNAEQVPRPESARLYELGRAALTEASPQRAVALLEQAVAADGGHLKARVWLALAETQIDQLDKARETVIEATAAAARRWRIGRVEARYLDAARAVTVGDLDRASAALESVAASVQGLERSWALLALSGVLEQAGRNEPALDALHRALREDPANSSARVRLGILLCRKRDYAPAAAAFASAEEAFTKSGNTEGLIDLLLARLGSMRNQTSEQTGRDLARVRSLTNSSGNKVQKLAVKFLEANLAERELDYPRAIQLATEALEEARDNRLDNMAAQALGELGYAMAYQKRFAEAARVLRQAVALAEKTRSHATMAANRMRLAEMLGTIGRGEEAAAAVIPAMDWLRRAGHQETLPMSLIKYASVLAVSSHWAEALPALREALELARRHGNQEYQAIAFQRIGAYLAWRDPRQAVSAWEEGLPLARAHRLTNVLTNAAHSWLMLGEHARSRALLEEAARMADEHPPGPDRQRLQAAVNEVRIETGLVQGRCEEATRFKPRSGVLPFEGVRLLGLLCTGQAGLADARAYRQTVHALIAGFEYQKVSGPVHYARASRVSLLAGDYRAARDDARQARLWAAETGQIPWDFEAALVLRAAERRLGNRQTAAELTKECLALAGKFGFDPPHSFLQKRPDLAQVWRMGEP